jgi:hypothetical protein
VTVYVEDVNDHPPQFISAPYHVTVDELTPTGKYHIIMHNCEDFTFDGGGK